MLNDVQLTERQIRIVERIVKTGEKPALDDDTKNDTENVPQNVPKIVLENAESLSKHFKVNISTIKRDLATLQRLGYLRHEGPANGGRWQVLKNVKKQSGSQ